MSVTLNKEYRPESLSPVCGVVVSEGATEVDNRIVSTWVLSTDNNVALQQSLSVSFNMSEMPSIIS